MFSFGGLGLVAFGLALELVILSFGGLRLGIVAQGLALGLGLVKVAIVPTLKNCFSIERWVPELVNFVGSVAERVKASFL